MSPPGDKSSSDDGDSSPSDSSGFAPLFYVRQFRDSDNEAVVFVREILSSAGIVLAIGLLLFAISGVWPPMVAVESPSMEPQMERGDLIFVMEEHRLAPDAATDGTGVVTYQRGQQADHQSFNKAGDVIIFRPDGSRRETPIIHRARFWVEEGENWYEKANESHLPAGVDNCEELRACPAPHAGFITKGDNNEHYDQAGGIVGEPVKPEWIRATAEVRIPWLGHLRLFFAQSSVPSEPSVSNRVPIDLVPDPEN
ncbi:S24/S26 family peptidase [Halorussus halophilus]|uniref:S26 family signal peptidase n=1 Tax=Halorussus halophilus TaxID=2650975 RepID=UPI0013010F33|nr:S26 family signal peptidase [Halorussus halophilus]